MIFVRIRRINGGVIICMFFMVIWLKIENGKIGSFLVLSCVFLIVMWKFVDIFNCYDWWCVIKEDCYWGDVN